MKRISWKTILSMLIGKSPMNNHQKDKSFLIIKNHFLLWENLRRIRILPHQN